LPVAFEGETGGVPALRLQGILGYFHGSIYTHFCKPKLENTGVNPGVECKKAK
jgi:hypothetical protein